MAQWIVQRIEIPATTGVLPECDPVATPAKFILKDLTTGLVQTDVVCLEPTPEGVRHALQTLDDAGFRPNDFGLSG